MKHQKFWLVFLILIPLTGSTQTQALKAAPGTLYCHGGGPDPSSAPEYCHTHDDPDDPNSGHGTPYGGDNVP